MDWRVQHHELWTRLGEKKGSPGMSSYPARIRRRTGPKKGIDKGAKSAVDLRKSSIG